MLGVFVEAVPSRMLDRDAGRQRTGADPLADRHLDLSVERIDAVAVQFDRELRDRR